MGFIVLTNSELVVTGLLLLLSVNVLNGQAPVIALEKTEVELSIDIPNNALTDPKMFITIRLDSFNGQNNSIVYVQYAQQPKVRVPYANVVNAFQVDQRVTVRIREVNASFAGNYQCYAQSSTLVIDNCNQLLIIIRKPDPPTITVDPGSNMLVGSRLVLMCQTKSRSLPPNHGLQSKIWWYNVDGSPVPQKEDRIQISAQNQLIISPLMRTDKGLKFSCSSADNSGNTVIEIQSNKSASFEVLPEYGPSTTSFTFTPALEKDAVIQTKVDESVNYRCENDCWPQCDITWVYKPFHGATDFQELTDLTDKKVLNLKVSRTKDGHFKCKAVNKHGTAEQEFRLEASYLDAPVVNINGEDRSSAMLPENTQVNLKCTFDSNPAPEVSWVSPSQSTLSRQIAEGPNIVEGSPRKQLYTSTFVTTSFKCEDTGLYMCSGSNRFGSVEGRINLNISCPPSSANIHNLGVRKEYSWEITKHLVIQFVIRALPEPDVTEIRSSLNGVMQNEAIPGDIRVEKTSNYDSKPYLTKFVLTSRRKLDQTDTGRDYTVTFVSSNIKTDLAFKIFPRGPPHKVENLKAIEISHNSLTLFWMPGFNGGDKQTFSIDHRVNTKQELETGKNYSWTSSVNNIQDVPINIWIEVKVQSLQPETDYVIRVTSVNVHGGSQTEINIRTTAVPSEALGAGAICGIVFGVLIFLAIIVVVIYFVIIRKKLGTHHGRGGRNESIWDGLAALFRRDKYKTRPVTSGRINGSATKESSWGKVKKAFLSKSSSRNSLDYLSVPPKDYNTENGPYESAVNNNALITSSAESGRQLNEEGLVYVEVDFSRDKKNNKNEKNKKKKKKKQDVHKSNESVNYSDIDFTKTAAKRREVENDDQRATGENDDYANVTSNKKYTDAGFGIGTTV